MPLEIAEDTIQFIREHRVARLATTGVDGQPAVIPICFAFDGKRFFSPIDEKPKRVAADSLKRVRNIQRNPRVALVIDDYSEDWNELSYVLIIATAEILRAETAPSDHSRAVQLLREKYPQYLSMKIDDKPIIKITPTRIKHWRPTE